VITVNTSFELTVTLFAVNDETLYRKSGFPIQSVDTAASRRLNSHSDESCWSENLLEYSIFTNQTSINRASVLACDILQPGPFAQTKSSQAFDHAMQPSPSRVPYVDINQASCSRFNARAAPESFIQAAQRITPFSAPSHFKSNTNLSVGIISWEDLWEFIQELYVTEGSGHTACQLWWNAKCLVFPTSGLP
jgi:hypothetical protein